MQKSCSSCGAVHALCMHRSALECNEIYQIKNIVLSVGVPLDKFCCVKFCHLHILLLQYTIAQKVSTLCILITDCWLQWWAWQK